MRGWATSVLLITATTLGARSGAAQAVPAMENPISRDGAAARRTTVPVLLVPGWFDSERELAALRIRLTGSGWDGDDVLPLSFQDPTGSNVEHAEEIRAAVDTLRARTGAARIDIVAHSMGGLATRLYLRQGGSAHVRRVVFMATPHRGTYMAYLAFGEGRDQMQPDSDFLEELNSGPSVPEGIETMTIRSPLDAVILPPESATLPGAENREVCCPTHAGLLQSLDAFRLVRRFLVDGPEPVRAGGPGR